MHVPITTNFHSINCVELQFAKWEQPFKLGISIIHKHFFNYQLGFGTLLGAIRDENIIEHDIDLDIDVMLKDEEDKIELFDEEMLKNDFILLRKQHFNYLGKDLQMSIAYLHQPTAVIFDVCFFRQFGEDYLHFGSAGVVIRPKYSIAKKEFVLRGMKCFVPKNYDQYLTGRYGNWRVPTTEKVDWEEDAQQGNLYIPMNFDP